MNSFTQPCAKALWKIFRKQITQIQGPQCYVFLFEKRRLDSQVGVSSAGISSSCCVYGPGEGCSPGQSDGAGGWVGPCAGPSSVHSTLGRASSYAAVLPGSVSAREASGSCPSAKTKTDMSIKHYFWVKHFDTCYQTVFFLFIINLMVWNLLVCVTQHKETFIILYQNVRPFKPLKLLFWLLT